MDEKSWLQANPGHCSHCGLLLKYCFHNNPDFRAEVNALGERVHTTRGWQTFVKIQERWHRHALDAMGFSAVKDLPDPFRGEAADLIANWLEEYNDPP